MHKIASDYGLRLFYEGVHNIGSNLVSHQICTSKIMQDKIEKSLNSDSWVENLALNLNSFVFEKGQTKIDLTKNNASQDQAVLYSWILASKNLKGGVII